MVEAEVRESQIACPTGWFPSKISTMLAFNIISDSMPNRRFPPTLHNPARRQESGEEV